ncbi:MAG: nucleotidyl transferase AbiEii/AbiGii toxin family protein [Methanosarcinales archaeon]
MITKIELQRLAKQNGINTHIQEKDYLQYHILHSLYSKTEDIVFKGGTCLKIVYGFDRFSEDLDFATNTHVENIISLIKKVITDLDYVGISANIKNQRTLKRGFYAILQYKGPLFQGTPISQGKIQLDFSFRGDVLLNPVWIPII